MADATAAHFLPPLVGQIEQARAPANVRVLPLATRDPAPLLERGDADLAVGHFPETLAGLLASGGDAALRHARLLETEYVCVMRAGHPLAHGELTLDAYCAAPHLLVSFSGRPHGLVDQRLAALDRTRRIVVTVNQYFTAGRVVANTDLLTVLPANFVASTGCADRLVSRPLPFALAALRVEMLWHRRHDSSRPHQWLRARMLEAADPSPG